MAVQFHYEPTLDYQLAAIDAVCDLFRGQEICEREFTVARLTNQLSMGFIETPKGIGNWRRLHDDQLLVNLKAVQAKNYIPQAEKIESPDFTVEMETGTGKTYVYLRTILELNKRYGFKKFVIIVPSVAIKEGVFKSLTDMDAHFKQLYGGVPIQSFVYDSARLEQVRDFATSAQIQVMVVTVGAINKLGDEADDAEAEAAGKRKPKASNVMYRQNEKVNDDRPIDLVAATNPIVIVDEPQSVDGGALDSVKGGQGRKAIARMNPMCTLRYSATHAYKHHMVYRLDALAAYEKRLVKRIEVAGVEVESAHNRPFVRLVRVTQQGGRLVAKVEVAVQGATSVQRKEIAVEDGEDLEDRTGRAVYKGVRIGEIQRSPVRMELRLDGAEVWLNEGEAHAEVGVADVKREMIRRTIKEHLDKELKNTRHGIKVLSLFFLDEVANYRSYDAEGQRVDGPYVKIFEEEYRRLARNPTYSTLFQDVDVTMDASQIHGGYFSIDRKGGKVASTPFEEREVKKSAGKDAADNDTYSLIMKDKQRLLDLGTKLKFIFSHSALREGWDNPNVFQICVLRGMTGDRERRQSVGRGMRLCVDQTGQRVRGEVNLLTVIADENVESFAAGLQAEIEASTGIKFGQVEREAFAVIVRTSDDGTSAPIGVAASKLLWAALKAKGYVEASGRVTDTLRRALRDKQLELPPEFESEREAIDALLRRCAGKVQIADADKKHTVKPRSEMLHSEDFKALWDRIKHKTTYRVEFDAGKLIADCAKGVADQPRIAQSRLRTVKASLELLKSGVESRVKAEEFGAIVKEADVDLPDILTELQDRTQLTRRSIARILGDSGRLEDFHRNPQQFIDGVTEVVNRTKRLALVEGIKYERVGADEYYAQELFESEELTGYLGRNVLEGTKRCVMDAVIYDSEGVEKHFAEQLEINEAVKVYAKLPPWFKVPTPLGSYNPDWAVLVNDADGERLYLVVETKGSLFMDDLRDKESAKIACGKAHFKTLFVNEPRARYQVGRTFEDVMK
ncbi:MAG: DEAD/DEAH box helicase family protein [Pseudomonadota bacterium]|nr:DEAD/DEAH box helicase family protein [Pseudomonadota bacterium]